MTPDLVQQFGPRLVTALTVALAFAALWVVNRERYLATWAGAWTVWTIRYGYAIVAGSGTTTTSSIVLPVMALATATLTLSGARALTRDGLPRTWIALVAADVVWLLVESITGWRFAFFGVTGATHWALLSAGLVWSGVLFLRSDVVTGVERAAAGGGLVVARRDSDRVPVGARGSGSAHPAAVDGSPALDCDRHAAGVLPPGHARGRLPA